MKKIERWLRSKTGLAAMASLLVAVALFVIAGFKLGWWPPVSSLGGTAIGPNSEVVVRSFTAEGQRDQAKLSWETKGERNIQGFYVYRAPSGTESFVQVNNNLIRAKAPSPTVETTYKFDDTDVESGDTYDYRLLAVGRNGEQVQVGVVTVAIP